MLKPPKRTRDIRSSDRNVLFVPRKRVKGLLLWRHQNCEIIPTVKLKLQKQFTPSERKIKPFHFDQAFPT